MFIQDLKPLPVIAITIEICEPKLGLVRRMLCTELVQLHGYIINPLLQVLVHGRVQGASQHPRTSKAEHTRCRGKHHEVPYGQPQADR
jgi:hypothetical protein